MKQSVNLLLIEALLQISKKKIIVMKEIFNKNLQRELF